MRFEAGIFLAETADEASRKKNDTTRILYTDFRVESIKGPWEDKRKRFGIVFFGKSDLLPFLIFKNVL